MNKNANASHFVVPATKSLFHNALLINFALRQGCWNITITNTNKYFKYYLYRRNSDCTRIAIWLASTLSKDCHEMNGQTANSMLCINTTSSSRRIIPDSIAFDIQLNSTITHLLQNLLSLHTWSKHNNYARFGR